MAMKPFRMSAATWLLMCESMGAAASAFGELAAAKTVEPERRAEYATKAAACEQLFELLPFVMGQAIEIKGSDTYGPHHEIRVDLQTLEMHRLGGLAAWMRLIDNRELAAARFAR